MDKEVTSEFHRMKGERGSSLYWEEKLLIVTVDEVWINIAPISWAAEFCSYFKDEYIIRERTVCQMDV